METHDSAAKGGAPIVAIVGPTGTGKTALALEIARRRNAESINLDSRQVYLRLDIGSAKPTVQERARVRHHLRRARHANAATPTRVARVESQ